MEEEEAWGDEWVKKSLEGARGRGDEQEREGEIVNKGEGRQEGNLRRRVEKSRWG